MSCNKNDKRIIKSISFQNCYVKYCVGIYFSITEYYIDIENISTIFLFRKKKK